MSLINNCGYKPIFNATNSNLNFKIAEYIINGDTETGNILLANLKKNLGTEEKTNN